MHCLRFGVGIIAVGSMALGVVSSLSFGGERESGGRRASMAIEVELSSSGSGIDHATQDEVLALANDEIRAARLVVMTVKPWGREGERTLCLEFSDLGNVRKVAAQVEAIVARGNESVGREASFSRLVLNCSGMNPKPQE